MNRFIPYLVLFCLVLLGLGYFVKYYVGDIRPVILPAFPSNDKSKQSYSQLNEASESAERNFDISDIDFKLEVKDNLKVGLFAKEAGARDLAFSPEGILLVSSPSKGEVVAFPINNKTVERKVVISRLSSPHGIAFFNGKLFIAEKDKLSRYTWEDSNQKATFEKELMKLPSGGHDAHTLVFDKNGSLYLKLGSSCNVCIEHSDLRAVVLKISNVGSSQTSQSNSVVFARGLRNAAFMTLNEQSGDIWATENGRDNLGDNLPPEEINILSVDGGMGFKNYGWPNCYGNKLIDSTFKDITSQNLRNTGQSICAETEAPVFEMQAHSAPLGLTFDPQGDLLVAFHGSWNRSVPTGYKVVRLNVENGKVLAQEDFLTGFINGSIANGRPVDLIYDKSGNLFISDDKAGSIYVVYKR